MRDMSRNKRQVRTTTFSSMDEPQEDKEKRVKAMREKIVKMREEKERNPMADAKEKKKKVALKQETINTIETMIKEGKSAPSIIDGVEKGHAQTVNERQIQAIYAKLCYRDKKFYDVSELFKEKVSKVGVLRPIVWSDSRGIMVSAKRIQDTFPDMMEHLKGGETTFEIDAVYDKKGKKVSFTLTGQTAVK